MSEPWDLSFSRQLESFGPVLGRDVVCSVHRNTFSEVKRPGGNGIDLLPNYSWGSTYLLSQLTFGSGTLPQTVAQTKGDPIDL